MWASAYWLISRHQSEREREMGWYSHASSSHAKGERRERESQKGRDGRLLLKKRRGGIRTHNNQNRPRLSHSSSSFSGDDDDGLTGRPDKTLRGQPPSGKGGKIQQYIGLFQLFKKWFFISSGGFHLIKNGHIVSKHFYFLKLIKNA